MNRIQAEEDLNQLYVKSISWMEGEDRDSALQELSRRAGLNVEMTKREDGLEKVTFDEFKQDIRRRVV